nr:MAG TPA: hypothetical protein [Caudoviricetes sp.]
MVPNTSFSFVKPLHRFHPSTLSLLLCSSMPLLASTKKP